MYTRQENHSHNYHVCVHVCGVVEIWSLLIQGFGEKYRNRKWKLREPCLLIVGLFPRLFLLPTWLQHTMNILGVQNSSNIVVSPGKLAASAQWLVLILVKETNVNECRWATDKLLLREKDFIPTALLAFVSPIFKEGRGVNKELHAASLTHGKVMKQIILGMISKHMNDKKVIGRWRGNCIYPAKYPSMTRWLRWTCWSSFIHVLIALTFDSASPTPHSQRKSRLNTQVMERAVRRWTAVFKGCVQLHSIQLEAQGSILFHTFSNGMDDGPEDKPRQVCSQYRTGWSGLKHQKAGVFTRDPKRWENALHQHQQREMRSPAPEKEIPHAPERTEADQLESNSAKTCWS